jgi:hypothetical protein
MSDLTFTPQSDEFIENLVRKEEEERLLTAGECLFEVCSAKPMVSEAGNPMIKITLKVWDCNNKSGFIYDFLMGGEKSFFIKKIKNFCECVGIIDKYNSGKLNAEDINSSQSGKLVLGIRKDRNGKLQNNVIEYIKGNIAQINNNAPFLNDSVDDINF